MENVNKAPDTVGTMKRATVEDVTEELIGSGIGSMAMIWPVIGYSRPQRKLGKLVLQDDLYEVGTITPSNHYSWPQRKLEKLVLQDDLHEVGNITPSNH
jgi:hypothetical protein